MRSPRGQKTVLLQGMDSTMVNTLLIVAVVLMMATSLIVGPRKSREAVKHFGRAPGVPHSHAKPYIRETHQVSTLTPAD